MRMRTNKLLGILMRSFLLIYFLIFSSEVFSCERKVPVNAQARLMHGKQIIEIKIEAPTQYENYRLSSALYRIDENIVPMYNGYEEELGTSQFLLRGTRKFLIGGYIEVVYTAVDAMCAHSEKINLDEVIFNCSNCGNDA